MAEKKVQTRFKRPKGLPLLKAWRKYRGDMTQGRLASAAGVSQGMVSQLETGSSDYTGELLEKLAYALRCEPADLIMRNPLLADPEGIWAVLEGLKTPQARKRGLRLLKALAEEESEAA